jgi:hypothetical protein
MRTLPTAFGRKRVSNATFPRASVPAAIWVSKSALLAALLWAVLPADRCFAQFPALSRPPAYSLLQPRFVAQPQFAEPQYAEPQYAQPQFAEPRDAEPQFAQPRYAEPQFAEPRYAEPQFAPPRYAEPQFAEPRFAEPR